MSAPSSLVLSPVNIEQARPTAAGDAVDGQFTESQDDKPLVFTVSFGADLEQSEFQYDHNRLVNMLFERSNLRHAHNSSHALALFAEYGPPKAVLVVDPDIMLSSNEVLSRKLVQYAAGGGTVVFGGAFAKANHEKLDRFFGGTWDLPWEAGSRHRTTLALNRGAVNASFRDELFESYSQKALFLQGVERHESWYLPTENSIVESYVPLPGPPDSDETPVACTQYGRGHVGYVGDVNVEEGTIAVVLGMLGLLA